MEKYSKVISVSGREFRASETMSDIFLAHASDIIARGELELVPLLHEGGVEMLLIGSMSRISITDAPMASVADISGPEIAAPASGLTVTSAA